jgi:two-component system, LytTR family, sensor kinase
MLKHRLFPWLALAAVCTLFGFLNAFESYTAANAFGNHHHPWNRALSWDLTGWLLWLAFTPLILRMVRRFPLDEGKRVRHAAVYAVAGLFFATLRTLLPFFIQFYIIHGTAGLSGFLRHKHFVLLADFMIALVVYGTILTFGHALNYYKQYRENELRASQLEAQLAQSQLQALKMQLHPHFLFNALNSISALQLEDTAAAQRMTARLGDFLRLTLENVGTHEVSLKQEMEFLKCYLDIERVRFGRRLTTDIQVEPETLDVSVPNLILQPIVENAIRHGIAPRLAPGNVSITARRENGHVQLQVKDDGPGLTLNGRPSAYFKEGLGLSNTRARLERLYGTSYLFELANAPEGGLIVTLGIPFSAGDDRSFS